MFFIRLVQLLVLSVALSFGTWLIYCGLKNKMKGRLFFGIILNATVISLVVVNIAMDVMMDWNPKIPSLAEAIGVYADDKESIELRLDNTFIYEVGGRITEGKWRREDWNLYFDPIVKNQDIRFVRFAGALRVMTHVPDDPDNWNGNPGLKRIKEL